MTKYAMIIKPKDGKVCSSEGRGNRMTGAEAISMITLFVAILTLLAMIIFGIINIFKK